MNRVQYSLHKLAYEEQRVSNTLKRLFVANAIAGTPGKGVEPDDILRVKSVFVLLTDTIEKLTGEQGYTKKVRTIMESDKNERDSGIRD